MREEPKIFGDGPPRRREEPADHLSILGIEPENPDAEDGYDDAIEDDYEEFDERPRGRVPWKIITAVIAVAIGGVGAAMYLGVGDTPVQIADVRLITADPTPFKHRPDDPGGLEVPYQDVEVFGTLNDEAGETEDGYEVLLPEPEEPLETMPEEAVVGTGDELPAADVVDSTTGEEVVILDAEPDAATGAAVPGSGVPPIPTAPPPRPGDGDIAGSIDTLTTTDDTGAASGGLSFDDVAASLSGEQPTQPQTVSPAAGVSKVQIAAYGTEQNARDAWALLQNGNMDLLGAYQPIIDTAVLASGTFYRLQIGPFASDAEARNLCESLHSRQVDCVIVAP